MNYRKKPVIVQAFQMTGERQHDNRDWPEWLKHAWQMEPGEPGAMYWNYTPSYHGQTEGLRRITINTLEGPHAVNPGDYIIRGIQGELYPCKPDIFEATYEEAPE